MGATLEMKEALAMSVAPSDRWNTPTSQAKARPAIRIASFTRAGNADRATSPLRLLARWRDHIHNTGSAKIMRQAALDIGPTSAKRTTMAVNEMIMVPPTRARKPARSAEGAGASEG